MENILITGEAGFIGYQLCDELLSHIYQIKVLDNLSYQVHETHSHRPSYLNDQIELVKGEWNWKAIDVINAPERDPKKYKQGIGESIEAVDRGILKPNEMLTHTFYDRLRKLGSSDKRSRGVYKRLCEVWTNQDK
jgi:dTDP-D-glucose 4,6-dehydratase